MLKLRQNTPRWVVTFLDLFIHLCALAFAYLIRFDLKADFSLEKELLYQFGPEKKEVVLEKLKEEKKKKKTSLLKTNNKNISYLIHSIFLLNQKHYILNS